MLVIIITIAFFSSFLIAIIYLFNKEKKESVKIDNLFQKLKSGINEIGYIQQDNTGNFTKSETKNEFLNLFELRRIFKYSDGEEFWIEFVIKDLSNKEMIFNINSVEMQINNIKSLSNTTLLFEKVPEYLEPPYGNRYYDILSYNDFQIGKNGQKYFKFLSSFRVDNPFFRESDFIKIEIEVKQFDEDSNPKMDFKNFQFIESFKSMTFKNIQSINEKINWRN